MEEEPEVGELWIFAYSNAKQAECRRNFLKEGFHHEKSYASSCGGTSKMDSAQFVVKHLFTAPCIDKACTASAATVTFHQKSRLAKARDGFNKSDL